MENLLPSKKSCFVAAVLCTFVLLLGYTLLYPQERTTRLFSVQGVAPAVNHGEEPNNNKALTHTTKNISRKSSAKTTAGKSSGKTVPVEVFQMIRDIQGKLVTMNPSVSSINISCTGNSSLGDTENLLCVAPPTFRPEYKNPCWYAENHAFRCLPYFQLIGMAKSASSDFFDRIICHPDILGNNGASNKETRWWSLQRYGLDLNGGIHIRSLEKQTFEGYLQYFRSASAKIEKNVKRDFTTGDGSPIDLMQNIGWPFIPQNKGHGEPMFINAHIIKHMNPDVKIIVILRDPVERLFSDYRFRAKSTATADDFHNVVVRGIQLIHECTRNASLRYCVYDRDMYVKLIKLRLRIHWGFYVIFLQDWFKVFPREQFFIMRTEDYHEDMAQQLRNVFKFLGARALPAANISAIVRRNNRLVTKTRSDIRGMKNETRHILEELYSTFNKHLAGLLNDQKFMWK